MMFLCGCAHSNGDLDLAMALRAKLQNGSGCSFTSQIIADYQDEMHSFALACQMDASGRLEFCVLEPDSINGITGNISAEKASLTFDDTVLAFAPLADGQIAPVIAPWLLMHSLKSGYLSATSNRADGYTLYIDDVYFRETVHVQLFVDGNNCPAGGEIYWQGRRILSLQIQNFAYV